MPACERKSCGLRARASRCVSVGVCARSRGLACPAHRDLPPPVSRPDGVVEESHKVCGCRRAHLHPAERSVRIPACPTPPLRTTSLSLRPSLARARLGQASRQRSTWHCSRSSYEKYRKSLPTLTVARARRNNGRPHHGHCGRGSWNLSGLQAPEYVAAPSRLHFPCSHPK